MLSPVQLKSSLEAAVQYNKDLNEEAVAFLEGRGISKEIADQYSLGYIKEPFATHENYQGWLSIPYITVLGHCVGAMARFILLVIMILKMMALILGQSFQGG